MSQVPRAPTAATISATSVITPWRNGYFKREKLGNVWEVMEVSGNLYGKYFGNVWKIWEIYGKCLGNGMEKGIRDGNITVMEMFWKCLGKGERYGGITNFCSKCDVLHFLLGLWEKLVDLFQSNCYWKYL